MNNDLPSLGQSLGKYDLADIIAVLIETHGRIAVAEAVLVHMPHPIPANEILSLYNTIQGDHHGQKTS